MHCQNCGAKVKPGAAVCLKCGFNPKSERNFCGACGSATKPAQVVCIKCGHALKSWAWGGVRGGDAVQQAMGGYMDFFKRYPYATFALVLLFIFLPYFSASLASVSAWSIATDFNFGSFLGVLVVYLPAVVGLVALLKAPGDPEVLRSSLGFAVTGLIFEVGGYLAFQSFLKSRLGEYGSFAMAFVSPGSGFFLTIIVYAVHIFSVKQATKN